MQRIEQMPVAPVDGVYQRAVFIPAAPGAYLPVGVAIPVLAHPAVAMPPGAGAVEFVFEENSFETGGTVGANFTTPFKLPVRRKEGNALQAARLSVPFFPENASFPDKGTVAESAVSQVLEVCRVGFQVGGVLNV